MTLMAHSGTGGGDAKKPIGVRKFEQRGGFSVKQPDPEKHAKLAAAAKTAAKENVPSKPERKIENRGGFNVKAPDPEKHARLQQAARTAEKQRVATKGQVVRGGGAIGGGTNHDQWLEEQEKQADWRALRREQRSGGSALPPTAPGSGRRLGARPGARQASPAPGASRTASPASRGRSPVGPSPLGDGARPRSKDGGRQDRQAWLDRLEAPSAAPAVPRMPEHVLHATSTKAEPVKTATVEAAALPQALEPRVRSARVEETNPPPHSAHVPTEANTAHGEHAALYAWLNDWGLTEYLERLVAHGYTYELLTSHDLNVSEVAEMHELIRSKPGHRVQFRRALAH